MAQIEISDGFDPDSSAHSMPQFSSNSVQKCGFVLWALWHYLALNINLGPLHLAVSVAFEHYVLS